jgi:hypothetical protein
MLKMIILHCLSTPLLWDAESKLLITGQACLSAILVRQHSLQAVLQFDFKTVRLSPLNALQFDLKGLVL